ncbi:MAG: site-specific DNA-methyltransferase [Candidatus Tectomicrobia bacterium]|nr:site-specific DNA-methyltransferase [Candidatus Tectomicrobia bacterium]
MRKYSTIPNYALNAICPYYAMFPLEFPMRVLGRYPEDTVVLDTFCGRGTTNYAAHVLGMKSYGIDASPVAVAIAQAKFAVAEVTTVLGLAEEILTTVTPAEIPSGVFWRRAFHPSTLEQICSLREGLLGRRLSNKVALLRALSLGCLHGPINKDPDQLAYFSNQMPRTFASKPDSAVRFWRRNDLKPPKVDVVRVLRRKADRALRYAHDSPNRPSNIRLGDSTRGSGLSHITDDIDLVVTSPPYYGLQTYIEDQWLRNWFLGGLSAVPYGQPTGLDQTSPDDFAYALGKVWFQIAGLASDDSRMVVRFGAVGSRKVDAKQVLQESLKLSGSRWRVYRTIPIGTSNLGKRQAAAMGTKSSALEEYDFFCGPA